MQQTSKVTGSGSTEITINPATTLDEKTDYYIKLIQGHLKIVQAIFIPE